MKLQRLLPLSLFALSACAPVKPPLVTVKPPTSQRSITQTIPSPQTATSLPSLPVQLPSTPLLVSPSANEPAALPPKPRRVEYLSVSRHANVTSAVEAIFSANKNLRMISFGEIHKTEGSNLNSTLTYFAAQVMPVLKKYGINDLVFEPLPSGKKEITELQTFYRTLRLGPVLSRWFAYSSDYCAVINAIIKAIAQKIKLHPCHVSGIDEYRNNLPYLEGIINRNALFQIQSLLGRGNRVASYTGIDHNDIKPSTEKEYSSFGHVLRRELGAGYVEVDIYVPELLPLVYNKTALRKWLFLVPARGVNLVDFENGSYAIILPRSRQPIKESPPEETPVCR
jgi:hypothetical protein